MFRLHRQTASGRTFQKCQKKKTKSYRAVVIYLKVKIYGRDLTLT